MIPAVCEGRSEVFSLTSKLKVAGFIFFPYQFMVYPIRKELPGGL